MPLYSYRCDNCGVQFDRRQHFDEPALRTCPECGRPALRKLIAPVGIVFKGSGFYSTDHRSTSGMNSSKAEKGESKPEKSEAKSETKPEASKATAGED
jgi:putative FmdB family regulatory protein